MAATASELDVPRQELDGIAHELPPHLQRHRALCHEDRELDLGLDLDW